MLLELDDEVMRAEVQQQEALARQQRTAVEKHRVQLAAARLHANRVSRLFAAHLVSAQNNDDEEQAVALAGIALRVAKETMQQSIAQLQQSKQRLEKTAIRAPMNGIVVSIAIKAGETAVPSASGIVGSNLVTIADPSTLVAEVNVDEADIARIRAGQEANVFAAGNPDAAVRARVDQVALTPRPPTLGSAPTGRSYTVKLRLKSAEALTLRPGMSCRAEIYTRTATDVVSVPIQSILSTNTAAADPTQKDVEEYVYLVEDGRAVRRAVRTGLVDDRYQEVKEGVNPGEHIVVGPYKLLRHLKPGDAVAPSLSADRE